MIPKLLWIYLLVLSVGIVGFTGVHVAMRIAPEVKEFSYLNRLGREGVVSEAIILSKGVRDTLTSPTDGWLRSALWLKVQFEGPDETPIQRVFGVSTDIYHNYRPGDALQVAYLTDIPGRYQIWHSADDIEARKSETRVELALSLFVTGVLGFAFVFIVVTLYFTNPRRGPEEVSFEVKLEKCPVCGSPVEAGSVRNPPWRPEGRRCRFFQYLPTLPRGRWNVGVTYRQLPGYHCPNCKTILFKYK
jgi:hypothetical protein